MPVPYLKPDHVFSVSCCRSIFSIDIYHCVALHHWRISQHDVVQYITISFAGKKSYLSKNQLFPCPFTSFTTDNLTRYLIFDQWFITKHLIVASMFVFTQVSYASETYGMWHVWMWPTYRQTSNISRTSVGTKIVDHLDVVGASPVGAAPTTSSFST